MDRALLELAEEPGLWLPPEPKLAVLREEGFAFVVYGRSAWVHHIRLDDDRVAAAVDRVAAMAGANGAPEVSWWVGELTTPAGLADRRASNRGRPRLTDDQRGELLAALKGRPPDGGLWSGPKVAAFVRARWAVRVCPQTGWQWLKDLGFTLQVPRPTHPRAATPGSRRRWGKKPAASAVPAAGPAPG